MNYAVNVTSLVHLPSLSEGYLALKTHTQTKIYKCFPCDYLSPQSSSMESVCTCLHQALCTQLGSPFSFSLCPSLLPPLYPSLSLSALLPCSTPHQEMSTTTPQRKSILSVQWGRGGRGNIYCQMSLRLPLTNSTP